ncbi:hypothetical protein HanPI659440_Chr03g0120191 [Helianthus annuus]|nr:hypothetical protein HanPI659440_Chr03g0120191 [Helianthus annuus]
MAPKEQKRKPATKKTDKTEEQIMSEPRHNMVAYLDPEGKITEFNEITRWLRKLTINEAITHQTPVYKTLVKEFWDLANVIEVDGTEIIRGQVKQQNVDVSADILNTVLQLNDNQEALYSIPIMCQRGCLLRIKCTDDILEENQQNKVVDALHVLTAHPPSMFEQLTKRLRYGEQRFDWPDGSFGIEQTVQYFNISKYLFSNMKENLRRTGVVVTNFGYPRFLQMITNVQHPDHPKEANDVLKIDVMIEHSLKIFKGVATKRYPEETPRKIFGALGDKNYVAPTNDKWRHDESQSDNEEPRLKKMMEDKFGRKKLDIFGDSDSEDGGDGGDDGGNVRASAASARGGDNVDSDSDDNTPESGYEHYIDERGIRQVRRICTDQD